jgi:hypothetical protein
MSNKVSEKEKPSNNITPYENKNKKDINSLIKKRKISYPKSLINSNNSNVIKTRQLPLLKRNKIYFNYDAFDTTKNDKNSQISYRRNKSNNNTIFDLKEKQKKKLILEINQSYNELKFQDNEIKKIQNLYGSIKKDNLTNQFLLHQFFNKEDKEKNQSIDKNNRNEKEIKKNKKIEKTSSKDEKYSNSNYETSSFFLTGTNTIENKNKSNYSSKNKLSCLNKKKNRTFLINENSSKLKFLKKELDYYIKTIDIGTQKLEKFKENQTITEYLRTKEELDKKNKELDDIINKSNGLQVDINDHDMVIYCYKLQNEKYLSLINDIKKKITSKYKPMLSNWEKRVQKLESQKEILEKQNKLYISEIDKMKEINQKNKKIENELKEFLENNEKYLDEKTDNNLEITNSYNIEQRLKQKIEIKNRKIETIKESNKELNVFIIKSEEDRKNKLIQKAKNEQIQKEKINKIVEEINNINKEIQKNSFKNIIELKNMENETKNNEEIIKEQKKEIEYLNLNEKKIINDINNLNKDLDIISKESEKQKNEMQLLIKTFEELKNNNNENDIKKENEKLLKLYDIKKNKLDEAQHKNNKLSDLLKEIKNI